MSASYRCSSYRSLRTKEKNWLSEEKEEKMYFCFILFCFCLLFKYKLVFNHLFAFFKLFNNYSSSPKAEWAIDSEALRARGIIVLVKSNKLIKNVENEKK